jgi:hypothetical protein
MLLKGDGAKVTVAESGIIGRPMVKYIPRYRFKKILFILSL